MGVHANLYLSLDTGSNKKYYAFTLSGQCHLCVYCKGILGCHCFYEIKLNDLFAYIIILHFVRYLITNVRRKPVAEGQHRRME